MTFSTIVWRRMVWRWAAPLAFCGINLIALVIYETTLEGGVETLASQHESATQHLDKLKAATAEIDEFLGKVDAHRKDVGDLYGEEFATQSQRFTRAVREVRVLARRAGLDPTSLSYPERSLGHGLLERGLGFTVEGTYEQMRNFMNLLELSDQFLTLTSIKLGDSGGSSSNPILNLRFNMMSVFATEEVIADARGGEDL